MICIQEKLKEFVNTGMKTSHLYPTIIICVNHVDPMDLENSCCFIHQYKTVLNFTKSKKKRRLNVIRMIFWCAMRTLLARCVPSPLFMLILFHTNQKPPQASLKHVFVNLEAWNLEFPSIVSDVILQNMHKNRVMETYLLSDSLLLI